MYDFDDLKTPIKLTLYTFFGLLVVFSLSRVQFELLWFSQFHLTSVLIKKWSIQLIGFILTFSIGLLFYKWQLQWTNLNTLNNNRINNRFSNIFYLLTLFIILILFTISLFLVLDLAFISLFDPGQLFSLGEIIKQHVSKFYFKFIFISLPIIFLLGRFFYIKLIHLISTFLISISFLRSWHIWSLAIAIPNSNINEPILNSDISFSLAKYAAFSFVLFILLIQTTLTLSLGISHYYLSLNRFSNCSVPILSIRSSRKLSKLLSFLLLNISLSLWLSRHSILWSTNNFFPGAGWLDVNFNIPIRTISSIFCLILSVILIFKSYKTPKFIIETIISLLIIIPLFLELLLTPLLQWILVRPRELSLEYKYINEAITSTRKAFQLDSIKTRLINPKSEISRSDLELGKSTLRNIRLWDTQPLLDTNRQLQQLRLYYSFATASVDRYSLNPDNNERQQVIISARQMDQSRLPKNSRSWLNKHFVYTHGYGFTLSPVNIKALDGLPEYFIKDLGKSTNITGNSFLDITDQQILSSIPIGNAALYYGTTKSPYAIAPTDLEELDYPEGDQNIFNHYSGTGGIPLSNIYQRVIASINLKEPRLLNTGVLNKNSRLLIRRELKQRIKTIAPFIELIGEPYLVSIPIDANYKDYDRNQHQYWIVEGYTYSKHYPYSSSIKGKLGARYIRNSVKIIVDAYNGRVKFYINELDDPIIKAWNRIFPELFVEIDLMPINLRDHLKVPTDMFKFQVKQLLRYHVTDVRTFYNGEDIWEVPKELYGKFQIPVEPYHITAQLSPSNDSEFLLLQPFSPLARPNLSGWLTARSDNKNYGELILLRFPSQTTIFGPEQIQALINQDPDISQQFSLWDRAGSEVIQGNLLVIPLGESLLYVEPVYLKATTSGLPTLTRIVVSDGKRIAMEKDLKSGINKLLQN